MVVVEKFLKMSAPASKWSTPYFNQLQVEKFEHRRKGSTELTLQALVLRHAM